uniref:Uncharacterized protein n=1 Tax=Oryza glaberrima TaxID=4538 RepID=I1PJU0_ORYGL
SCTPLDRVPNLKVFPNCTIGGCPLDVSYPPVVQKPSCHRQARALDMAEDQGESQLYAPHRQPVRQPKFGVLPITQHLSRSCEVEV